MILFRFAWGIAMRATATTSVIHHCRSWCRAVCACRSANELTRKVKSASHRSRRMSAARPALGI